MSGERPRRSRVFDFDPIPSRRSSRSYQRSPSPRRRSATYTSYGNDPFSFSRSRAVSPRRTSTSSYTHTRTHTYRASSPPRRGRSPNRNSGGSSSNTPYYTTPPSTRTHTIYTIDPRRRRSPSRQGNPYYTSRELSYSPPPAPRRSRARSRSRSRSRSKSKSRARAKSTFNSVRRNVSSALHSVPREELHDFGAALGGFVADRLGWSGVDGRTTDQRAGRDRWRGRGDWFGYSTMA